MERFADQLDRLRLMGVDDGETWDLSDNDQAAIKAVLNSHARLLAELKHLVRLLEPLEQDGRLNVPGLATLNGARAAITEAEAERGAERTGR